jgi:DNA modification methylase
MKPTSTQFSLPIPGLDDTERTRSSVSPEGNGRANRLSLQDRAFHDWYRFVLSFPPHLVRSYLEDFGLDGNHVVLDPFCGTGTTLVEAKKNGIPSVGLEANPFAFFASSVKVDWEIDADLLNARAQEVADAARKLLGRQGIDDNAPFDGKRKDLSLASLDEEATKLILTNSISPVPLHKTLILLDCLKQHSSEPTYRHGILALASVLVFKISNLHFGPEVGVGKLRTDVPVIASWLSEIKKIANDLRLVAGNSYPGSDTYLADARKISDVIPPGSIDAVITSPPYPNEKDYTRTTRLESVVLGFIRTRGELRGLKQQFIRSNTRGAYKGDDDDKWITDHAEIQQIAATIEKRRLELGKTSGFEKQYGRVTRLHFGGMARHLAELRTVLRPGARLAYVVGDQASYFRIMIRTGHLLADIAQKPGYDLIRTDLFRERFATATKEKLREEVVVLRWGGGREGKRRVAA